MVPSPCDHVISYRAYITCLRSMDKCSWQVISFEADLFQLIDGMGNWWGVLESLCSKSPNILLGTRRERVVTPVCSAGTHLGSAIDTYLSSVYKSRTPNVAPLHSCILVHVFCNVATGLITSKLCMHYRIGLRIDKSIPGT